jgi:hypothetical protein
LINEYEQVAATNLEFIGPGKIFVVAKPARHGGASAMVVHSSDWTTSLLL